MQAALLSNNPPPATREPPLHKAASAISALFHLHSRWLLFAKGYNAKGLWQFATALSVYSSAHGSVIFMKD